MRNDTTINDLWARLQAAENKLKQSQLQSHSHLPSHREMGGHRTYLPAEEGRASHSATAGELQRPSVLTTPADQPAHLGATSSLHTSQLVLHHSASKTLGQEKAMESDSQAESESQEQ